MTLLFNHKSQVRIVYQQDHCINDLHMYVPRPAPPHTPRAIALELGQGVSNDIDASLVANWGQLRSSRGALKLLEKLKSEGGDGGARRPQTAVGGLKVRRMLIRG